MIRAQAASVKIFGSRLLSIVGVIITAFTIFSNLKGILEFSNFVRKITEGWREGIAYLVNYIVDLFGFYLDVPDAVMVFAVFSCIIVAALSQKYSKESWSKPFRFVSICVAALFNAFYLTFVVAGGRTNDPRFEDEAILYFLVSAAAGLIFAIPVFARSKPVRNTHLLGVGIFGFAILAFFLLVNIFVYGGAGDGFIFEFITYGMIALIGLVVVLTYYVSSPVEVSTRSFFIVAGIVALIGINAISLQAEKLGIAL